MPKKTQEEIIEGFKLTHGDYYDYSLVEFVDSKTKIIIICNKHGKFLQSSNNHQTGYGCYECGIESIKGRIKHCELHGDFSTIRGQLCPACRKIKMDALINKPTEDFIKKAILVHGDRYEYCTTKYAGSEAKVKVICQVHGEFEVIANNHLRGHHCGECAKKVRTFKTTKNVKEFTEDSKNVHGGKYDYREVEYKNAHVKVKIICPQHGKFEIKPNAHLNGQGCSKCGDQSRISKLKDTTEIFIKKATAIHGDTYGYEKVDYKNTYVKVSIFCKKHGYFEQIPNSHLSGNGCLKCAQEFHFCSRDKYLELAKGRDTMIYLIRCYNNEEEFYKLGRTLTSIKKRYPTNSALPYEHEVVSTYKCESIIGYDLELELHSKYKKYKYIPTIKFQGFSECYNTDLPINEIINL